MNKPVGELFGLGGGSSATPSTDGYGPIAPEANQRSNGGLRRILGSAASDKPSAVQLSLERVVPGSRNARAQGRQQEIGQQREAFWCLWQVWPVHELQEDAPIRRQIHLLSDISHLLAPHRPSLLPRTQSLPARSLAASDTLLLLQEATTTVGRAGGNTGAFLYIS